MSENAREGSFIKTLMTIIGVVACLAALATVVAIFAKECKKKISTIAEGDSECDVPDDCDSCEGDCKECEKEDKSVEVDCDFADAE